MGQKSRENTHTHIQRAPLLLMHDQSIMHFCAFTHRWQDNRITEKRIWKDRICQDCGNSQIPPYNTKDGGRAAQLSLTP